jgi:hypothetical protein
LSRSDDVDNYLGLFVAEARVRQELGVRGHDRDQIEQLVVDIYG